jgi:hypothetical protein
MRRDDWMTDAPMPSSKGLINIIELIIVLITLFVSFNLFFPGNSYSNRWEDAYSLTKARDAVLTMDRIGKLHEYAFNGTGLQEFLGTIFPFSDAIFFSTISGGIKGNISVACNCTNDALALLQDWSKGMVINGRAVNLNFCKSDLNDNDSCTSGSDVILIWGYKSLSANYNSLSQYALHGVGIVEVMDFTYGGSGPNPVDGDVVQSELFGLTYVETRHDTMSYAKFSRTPKNVTDYVFEPYKYFYHMPITMSAGQTGWKSISGCSLNPAKMGYVTVRGGQFGYWICNSTDVWFDTDRNGTEDTDVPVSPTGVVSLSGYNVSLNYVFDDHRIGVSFKPTYTFDDFLSLQGGGAQTHVEPAGGDSERTVIKSYNTLSNPYPAMIANRLGSGNLLWIANFTEGGYGDDEKALLLSSLLWTSSKESAGSAVTDLRVAYMASYLNTVNRDMFEVYKFNFGVGYPF